MQQHDPPKREESKQKYNNSVVLILKIWTQSFVKVNIFRKLLEVWHDERTEVSLIPERKKICRACWNF